MTTNSKLPEICKEAFKKAREKLGISAKDLGGMACLSTRQIEQIENGETSSFYGSQIKITAAKKVARLLNLSDEEAFQYGAQIPGKLDAKQDAALELEDQVGEMRLPAAVVAEAKKELVTKERVKEAPFSRAVAKPKSTSQKKIFLWLGVLAAAVFSVVNLQPLFFADKPEEIIVVKEEMIEPAPPQVVAPIESAPGAAPVTANSASASTAEVLGACPAEEGIISYKPEAPRKVADMVYVQAKSKQIVCVIDASGKTQNKLVEPGVGASFYGKSPFKVLTAGLNQVDVYFQGAKVRLSNPDIKTLILEASEVLNPLADRTDSQPR